MSLDREEPDLGARSLNSVDSRLHGSQLRSRHSPAITPQEPATDMETPTPTPASTRTPTLFRVETWSQALYAPHSINIYHHARRALVHGVNSSNLLLLFLPLGIVAGALGWNAVLVFAFNLLATIPLSALVSDASDKLSDEVGEVLGSLVNATFGNSVELTAGILAVINGRSDIAQSVMIGSILSDLLLVRIDLPRLLFSFPTNNPIKVLGFCMLSAAWDKDLMPFNPAVADTLSSLMIITTMAIILPTALASALTTNSTQVRNKIVEFSHGTALILLVLYICYLYFQMKSHRHLFERAQHDHDDDPPSSSSQPIEQLVTLVGSAVGVVACTYFMFQSMVSTAHTAHVSTSFIATILIPIASNSAEAAAVIAVSRSGDIDFAISIIVSSILQIGLCVIPIIVILGWIIHQQTSLDFDSFNTVILFFSVLAVNYMLREGKYSYIHGIMLVGYYVILTIAFVFR
ncbi:hypothetical protein UA08_06276 [Talaromyces atroroseus]|uniref:Vacuolar calcium ion transporter n=1 Tax=Talaromyces atroroseus TaxID=1441469 RepID=A0A225AH67_TALAT|nr:hypothetical protein UA08_06276 [Talaromyces atroroseus]OKL58573.1 hypothetical protein UA08_06276 [Talaromyces atroroseus]